MTTTLHDPVRIEIFTALNTAMSLRAVKIQGPMPSSSPELWLSFLKREGRRIPVSPRELLRLQGYMREHGTEAITEDGETIYTVANNCLLECNIQQVQPNDDLELAV